MKGKLNLTWFLINDNYMHSQRLERQITWAKRHFWKLHFKEYAVGDLSDPLHGSVPEAENFNRWETATPGVRPGFYFIFIFLRKEKKELT